jgi:glycosyltransferase involved in cell wall biosynthesis
MTSSTVAVVIPCYRVKRQILQVLSRIGEECDAIYVVDDACPEGTGSYVEENSDDARVRVLLNDTNQGVGGAMVTGYRAALADGATVIVKLDGDGQMDPAWIPRMVQPILDRQADYVKGNRFFDLESVRSMPTARLLGNGVLSFLSKVSTGYWNLFDPTNGFTAIHASVARQIPLHKLSRGYFFETDVLFRLNTLRALVWEVPVPAHYGAEQSSLVIRRVLFEFLWKHVVNTVKRLFYGYFLRNFSIASIEIVLGPVFLVFGTAVGISRWGESAASGVPATSGTVMLAALPILIGFQLLLSFLSYDVQNIPRDPVHPRIEPPGSAE